MSVDLEHLAGQIVGTPFTDLRRLVALVGPPASGKSTLSSRFAEAVARAGSQSVVVQMDGFHLHNDILLARGLLSRKGAPATFDVPGLLALMRLLKDEPEFYAPRFNRDLDSSIGSAVAILPHHETVIVEGNYLLLRKHPWTQLHGFWDYSVMLDVPLAVLEARLLKRWIDIGLPSSEAERRVCENDLPNAKVVVSQSAGANMFIRTE